MNPPRFQSYTVLGHTLVLAQESNAHESYAVWTKSRCDFDYKDIIMFVTKDGKESLFHRDNKGNTPPAYNTPHVKFRLPQNVICNPQGSVNVTAIPVLNKEVEFIYVAPKYILISPSSGATLLSAM